MKASTSFITLAISVSILLLLPVSCSQEDSDFEKKSPENFPRQTNVFLRFKENDSDKGTEKGIKTVSLSLAGHKAGHKEIETLDLLAFDVSPEFKEILYHVQGIADKDKGDILLDISPEFPQQTLLLLPNAEDYVKRLLATPEKERSRMLEKLGEERVQLIPQTRFEALAKQYGTQSGKDGEKTITVKLKITEAGTALVPKEWDTITIGPKLP